MIALATSDEVEEAHKRIDALLEYLNVVEVRAPTTTGFKINVIPKLIPNATNQTPPSK